MDLEDIGVFLGSGEVRSCLVGRGSYPMEGLSRHEEHESKWISEWGMVDVCSSCKPLSSLLVSFYKCCNVIIDVSSGW